jgi:hypothetical protein
MKACFSLSSRRVSLDVACTIRGRSMHTGKPKRHGIGQAASCDPYPAMSRIPKHPVYNFVLFDSETGSPSW